MGQLITGIVLVLIPPVGLLVDLLTGANKNNDIGTIIFGFLFFWIVGGLLIMVGLDKVLPNGFPPSSGGSSGSDSEPRGHYKRVYHYDEWGEETGCSEEWVKDK